MKDPVPIARALREATRSLSFDLPVAFVYHPLDYAREASELYLRRFARPGPEALLVGMNPGPFGMVQTGVPFGEVRAVRDWLGIEARIGRPPREHAARRVEGFACARSEISGARLWGWARERFGSPERFFARAFVWNYCPLAFLEESGRNRTPDKLPAAERAALFAPCDEALRALVRWLRPRLVVGIGAWAEARARAALAPLGATAPSLGTILHPSPASPLANRGWAERAEAQLAALGFRVGAGRGASRGKD